MGEVEFVLKQSVQEEGETFSAGTGAVFAGDCDDSFVDQFLNLQDVDFPENLQITTKDSAFRTPPSLIPPTAVAGEEDLASVLTLPEEEPELEWLSQFMEDSFSPIYPAGAGIPPENDTSGHFPPAPGIPLSRRTKRQRPGLGPVWPVSSCSATESTTSSSSSSSATSSPWPPTSPSTPLEIETRVLNMKKKPKNRAGPGSKPGFCRAGLTRTCSHCGSQKTPQWRAGPMGLKTLCNACGVRFKSGRLFPEYRPASSPTFSSAAHSNSHRKVLEMRKKRAVLGLPETGLESGLTSLW